MILQLEGVVGLFSNLEGTKVSQKIFPSSHQCLQEKENAIL